MRYDTVKDTVYDTVNEPGFADDLLSEKEMEVLELLRRNLRNTIRDLTVQTGFSRATVTRALSALKRYRVIRRVGSDKTGHWELLD